MLLRYFPTIPGHATTTAQDVRCVHVYLDVDVVPYITDWALTSLPWAVTLAHMANNIPTYATHQQVWAQENKRKDRELMESSYYIADYVRYYNGAKTQLIS